MSDNNRIKYSERPTTPPEKEDATIFYRESRTVYSEDGDKFVKMSPYRGFDFDFDKITEVTLRHGTKYICDEAFEGRDHLRSVSIPPTVTHIGDNAFLKCKSLESIAVPNSVEFIGYQAFAGCSSLRRFDSALASEDGRCLIINNTLVAVAPCELEELHIPESVTSIASGVFAYCPSLKSVYLPDSLVKFPLTCFTNCSSLDSIFSNYASEDHKCIIIDGKLILCIDNCNESYSIPESVIAVGVGAFGRNSKIREIFLPDSVRVIETAAFAGCSSLTSINISNGLESIGYGAFARCTSLKNIILPDTVKSIGASAFEGCSGLTGIVLSNHLESIGPETFKDCSSLIFVSVPDSISSIGERAFENCSDLESITLPQGLKIIENNLFEGCEALRHIELPESIQIIKRMSFWGCEKLQSISFPSTLESIEEVAFNYCRLLEKVDLSKCTNLQTIERSTFYACSGIKSIVFPASLSSIEKEAFSYCSSLETLSIPKSLKRIEYKAFSDCGMKSVYFQSADILIDHYAFNFCRRFEKVFIPSGTFDFFYPLLKSLTTINFSGHMTFVEVGDSINDVKRETKRILSDTFINKPLYRLGNCHPDYSSTSERLYFAPNNGDPKRIDVRVIDISCFSSCTGCLRIGGNVVYNWPGDSWLQDDSSKCLYPAHVSELLKEANDTEDKDKRCELLLLALKLTLQEIDSKGIVIDETLRQVIGFELSDSVRKYWSYTGYDTGKDPSPPSSMAPPPGGTIGTTIGLILALIRILGERLYTDSCEA